jgi:hypothetical protein
VAETRKIKLAHPLTAEQAERVHAKDVKDYHVGDEITVPLADARSIVDSGYAAGVDPADADAVRKALGADTAPSAAAKTAATAKADK